jgi:tRNA (guanine37-N1)-methyltransferase
MVMMAGPVAKALRSVKRLGSRTIYLSPQGKPLTAAKCRELAEASHLILLCGHYEGVDERVLESEVDEEISIGDYVLTNGCLAAIVLVDALLRFVPGVLGHEEAAAEDSFERGLLDCPHYTRPEVYEGRAVPPVLLSGNHQEIAKWRKEKAVEKTRRIRPDLSV